MFSRFLPAPLIGLITGFLHGFNLVLSGLFVYPLGLLKYCVPIRSFHHIVSVALNKMPIFWTDLNDWSMRLFTRLDIKIIGDEKLSTNDWYLMTANHCSWTDVLILYRVFNHRLPVLKFFMKSQLLWMPVLGLGCWLIGYPFMKRHTKEQIEKNPSLKGTDLETTKKMCEKFKAEPMTVVSFAEGTRYTKQKAKRQNTPFKHLLKPRAGGLAYTLMAMGGTLKQFVNVTIVYPQGKTGFWDYLTGRLNTVIIKVDVQPITEKLMGDYENDRAYRAEFQQWLNALWEQKDKDIALLLEEYGNKNK